MYFITSQVADLVILKVTNSVILKETSTVILKVTKAIKMGYLEDNIMHKIEFSVPLSGSKLFDVMAEVTAKKLCAKFPGLQYEYKDSKEIRIFGELNDYWYEEFNKAVFELGSL